ncbi:MAG TPA: sulfurtransferase [Flavisolibacter sp.]|nr:sulfurtransferase [Flavisolibacter sp.]
MRSSLPAVIKPAEALKFNQYILIDARSGPGIIEKYKELHLKGAIHVDLDTDLSSITGNAAKGGRHPLPDIAAFSKLLSKLGITKESVVFIYDDKSGINAASRFWWMLKNAGHANVSVIDGGMDAAIKAGFQLSTGEEKNNPAEPYPVTDWSHSKIPITEVEKVLSNPEYIIIDVREAKRYEGITEPIDKIAGHIPGAVNIPLSENLNADGTFKSSDELFEKYKNIIANRNPDHVIVHCGSGVTACHTLLAMEHAGIHGPKLFVGSWSEWSESGRQVATGK